MNRECGISTVDESEIPEKWRAASLSKIEMPPDEVRNMLPGCYYRDSDFCFLDDPAEGDYVDLIANPEAFTGYEGLSANRVWSSIYNENCFGLSELNLLKSPAPALVSLPDSLTDTFREDESESYEQCLEKKSILQINIRFTRVDFYSSLSRIAKSNNGRMESKYPLLCQSRGLTPGAIAIHLL